MKYWQFGLFLSLLWFGLTTPTDILTFIEVWSDEAKLQGANFSAISPDGRHVYVSSGVGDTIVAFSRQPTTGKLSLIEVKQDGVAGVDGLDGSVSVTVSPDGRHVYSTGVNDNAVAIFRRGARTGRLRLLAVVRDEVNGVDGLAGADMVIVSPDGRHVYVAGDFDNAVAAFQRTQTTGRLSFIEVEREGVNGVAGLAGSESLSLSPDGRHLYVAGDVANAVAVFSRDIASGALTFVEVKRDNVAGVDGLTGAEFVTVSPDGRHVYVASFEENALALFSRNQDSGALTFLGVQRDGVDGVDGLGNAVSIAISHDGAYLYVAGTADHAVAVFQRDPETGLLRFVEVERDGVNGVEGLARVNSVRVSADGQHLYAAGWADNAVVVFRRQEGTTSD